MNFNFFQWNGTKFSVFSLAQCYRLNQYSRKIAPKSQIQTISQPIWYRYKLYPKKKRWKKHTRFMRVERMIIACSNSLFVSLLFFKSIYLFWYKHLIFVSFFSRKVKIFYVSTIHVNEESIRLWGAFVFIGIRLYRHRTYSEKIKKN